MCWLDRMFRSVTLVFVAVLFVAAVPHPAAAQKCTDEEANSVRSEWVENPADLIFADDVAAEQSQAVILERLEAIAAMFRESYPEPFGTEAHGGASIRREWDEIDEGPVPWGYISNYMRFMCVESTGEIQRIGETGNWAYVYVNQLHPLLDEVGEMTIDGERTRIYMLSRRIGEFRGETLYAGYYEDNQRALLFTRPGEVPWIPVSQKQYLEGLAIYYREQQGETSSEMDQFVRDLEAQLEEIKRTTTGETRDQLVAEMERAIAEVKAQLPKNEQNLDAGIAEAQAYIDDYLATHSEQEMQQPAFLLQGQDMNFLGEFTDEADGGYMIVQVNQDYFRDDVSPETAQTIMLFWEWELWQVDEPVDVSARWRDSFERNFPIERLKAMLGS